MLHFYFESVLRAVIIWACPRKEISLMAKVELKQPIVDEIKAKVEGAATVVLVDYRGLTVEQDKSFVKDLERQDASTKYTKTH